MDGIKRPTGKSIPQKKPAAPARPTRSAVPAASPAPAVRTPRVVRSSAAPARSASPAPGPRTPSRPPARAQVQSMLPPIEQVHPPLSAPGKKEAIAEQYFSKKTTTPPTINAPTSTELSKRKGPRTSVLIGLAFVAVVIAGVAAMSAFGAMVVKVTPREQLFKLEKPAVFELAGSKVSADKTVSVTRTATKKQAVRSAASGRIKIINNYGTDAQPLAASTRFASPAGKIYRIREAVTVPGAKKEGTKLVPASIEVTVFADQPGTEYNITAPTTFTIPGFRGSPKYQGFSAESVGVIDGGFIGESGVVTAEDINAASAELSEKLKAELAGALQSSATEGFTLILFGSPSMGAAQSNPLVGKPAESFEVSMQGSVNGVLVRTEDLNQKLEEILFEKFPSDKNSLETLSFEGFSVLNFSDAKEATIQLSDSIRIAVLPDATQLRTDIENAKVSTIKDVFSGYSAIESADVRFTPSWWRRIPSRPSRIHIEVLSP